MIVKNDRAALQFHLFGTNTGPVRWYPATGKPSNIPFCLGLRVAGQRHRRDLVLPQLLRPDHSDIRRVAPGRTGIADRMSSTPRHDPGAAMRLPAFRAYVISRAASGAAMTIVQAAIAWPVYEISGSTLQLGLIGLVRFVPALGVSLLGGAAADVYDRRKIIQLAQIAPLLATFVVLAAIATGQVSLLLLYGVVLVSGLASSFENPARQALLPQIVPREVFTNAITVNSTVQSLFFVTGPIVAGALIG
ncbi:MAG: MFS transporter [Dehalococcoidia bacterium]|nr:MFS transporter [Dehalococcoidia bacterium]